jgi:hypothetical protein
MFVPFGRTGNFEATALTAAQSETFEAARNSSRTRRNSPSRFFLRALNRSRIVEAVMQACRVLHHHVSILDSVKL